MRACARAGDGSWTRPAPGLGCRKSGLLAAGAGPGRLRTRRRATVRSVRRAQ